MSDQYNDGRIETTDSALVLHAYYFPFGSKHIAFTSITGYRRVGIDALRGQWRIWGTSNPKYWAPLDPQRPRKKVGFIISTSRHVQPFITPNDPDAFEALLRERTGLSGEPTSTGKGPLI